MQHLFFSKNKFEYILVRMKSWKNYDYDYPPYVQNTSKNPIFVKRIFVGEMIFFFYLKHKTVCSTLFNRPIHHNHRLLYKLQPRQNVFINE